MNVALFRTGIFAGCLGACLFAGDMRLSTSTPWNARGAAAYLDARLAWWMSWQHAARDHETFCASCHTVLPYALARPTLRAALGEHGPSPTEVGMLDNIKKRVRLWDEVGPYYWQSRTAQSRGTESVLNALILARYDALAGTFTADTRLAFDHMWAEQLAEGNLRGAWRWLEFQLAPWEARSED